jgi:hypothetical protein
MNIPEQAKPTIDAIAAAGTGAAWLGWLPDAVALLTALWVLIRIWETETMKRLVKKVLKL